MPCLASHKQIVLFLEPPRFIYGECQAHHSLPIEIGQTLAGWRLVNASSADQKAEFSDTNNDRAIINLNQIHQEKKFILDVEDTLAHGRQPFSDGFKPNETLAKRLDAQMTKDGEQA